MARKAPTTIAATDVVAAVWNLAIQQARTGTGRDTKRQRTLTPLIHRKTERGGSIAKPIQVSILEFSIVFGQEYA
jgi:hypothetical protein